jgi:hypothetical protein
MKVQQPIFYFKKSRKTCPRTARSRDVNSDTRENKTAGIPDFPDFPNFSDFRSVGGLGREARAIAEKKRRIRHGELDAEN